MSSPAPADQELRVVSVSLGSSTRDHTARAELLGRSFLIERRGTDGDFERAARLIAELDGQVAAIGLGGFDLYIRAGDRRYTLRHGQKLARAARQTPLVDGSGLKDTLERSTIRHLLHQKIIQFQNTPTLLVCAVDRFGMANELEHAGARCTFGDLLFILNLPVPLHSLRQIKQLGAIILPIARHLPPHILYPTGDKQTQIESNTTQSQWMQKAKIIAGDFLLIRRYLPQNLNGHIIITNTVTSADVELLRERGAGTLITTTPEFGGRSFGTNVMEGVFAALGARSSRDYQMMLQKLQWQPRIETLNSVVETV